MGDAPEVVRVVGVNDFRMASVQQPFHLDHRLLGVAPGTVGILLWWKVGFKDRFEHQHCCCHADAITQGRDAGRCGVPQGGVISPLLSNLYLTEVDRMLERAKEATQYDKYTYIEYARFADD